MDNRKRTAIQTIAAIIQNANFKGFFTGRIYDGKLKQVCVPGLNCYSCPGAIGACPVGSLQNSLSAFKFHIPYYVMGLLLFFGTLLGRAVCAFLCPFGFLQDLLYKLPFIRKIKAFKYDIQLRYFKYIILIVFVIVLPIIFKLTPAFCKYLCPSGTLSGLLLGLADKRLFSMFGTIFTWKLSIFLAVIILSIILCRPFCKYLCPLGALYGVFNRVSFLQIVHDSKKCTRCNICYNNCDMCVNPSIDSKSVECIRCGKCISACPNDALNMGIKL